MEIPWEIEGEADALWLATESVINHFEDWLMAGGKQDTEATDLLIGSLEAYKAVLPA